ncbi:sensor histidine kinase [Paenibacillus harenae]|uniref:sensor histidine kinase n=1 Tax=Paenibacillus harenae TaxID=306543 RepID=UPI00041548F5|nr:sensor histidine kinase [Paenibacillus harenae]
MINRAIIRLLQNLSLKRKLLLSYSLLIIIPLMTVSLYSFSKISELMHEKATYSAVQSFNQTHSYLSYKLYKIISASDLIATDKRVNEVLSKSKSDYPLLEQVTDMSDMVRYLSSFKDKEDISNVRLFVQDGLVYSEEGRNLFNMKQALTTEWYQRLMASKDKAVGLPSSYFQSGTDKPFVTIARKIVNNINYPDMIGLLLVDVHQSNLERILSSANSVKESYSFLLTGRGELVAGSTRLPGSGAAFEAWPGSLTAETENDGLLRATLAGKPIFYMAKEVPGTDWRMTTVIPESSIVSEVNRLRLQFFIQAMLLVTVAYACAYYISVSITRRVSRLVMRMKRVQDGDLNSIIPNKDKDEIGELIENYNFMLRRIASLVQEQYQTGQDLKSAELKALQSQINPHFLYNTLDLINWLSQKNKVQEIRSVTLALANFYKFSLNKGRDISTLDYELRHISSYVQIQNIRFRNGIELRIEVDPELLRHTIPKITLQPLVENAILHGLLEKPEKGGVITIRGWLEQREAMLVIEDNGAGMPQDRLRNIISGSPISERGSHYAIRNIRERLRLVYGDSFRLEFSSTEGEGTRVLIAFPA